MPDQSTPPPAADPTPPASAQAAFDRLRAQAVALPASQVVPWYGDPALMAANVRLGSKAAVALKDVLAKALPLADWHLAADAPDRAEAAWHAFALADRTVADAGRPFAEHRTAVSKHRNRLLLAVGTLVDDGLVDQAALDAVREGSGSPDLGEDVIQLCALVKGAGKAGLALLPKARLDAARSEAQSFLDRLRPGDRKGGTGKQGAAKDAADLRDRYFTLMLLAYDECLRIGHWHWLHELDRHVPPLLARRLPA